MDSRVVAGILAATLAVLEDEDDFNVVKEYEDRQNEFADMMVMRRISKKERTKLKGFLAEIVPHYSPSEFYAHFRMKRSTVEIIVQEVGQRATVSKGRCAMAAVDMVLLGVWTLANKESFRQISDRFDVSHSTAHDVFYDFCQILVDSMPKYITWPTIDEMHDIAEAFHINTGFPGVIGAIGSCQVPIKKPPVDGDSYYNRKKFFSINLVAVVDDTMSFTDVNIGWPGSVPDARVYRNSPLHTKLTGHSLPCNMHVVGSCAFPLSDSLLVPYKDTGHLTERQSNFNAALSATKVKVNHAFSLLRGKFGRIQDNLDVTVTQRASVIVGAACVLHNICINENDWCEDDMYISDDDDDDDADKWRGTGNGGQLKRDEIAKRLE